MQADYCVYSTVDLIPVIGSDPQADNSTKKVEVNECSAVNVTCKPSLKNNITTDIFQWLREVNSGNKTPVYEPTTAESLYKILSFKATDDGNYTCNDTNGKYIY